MILLFLTSRFFFPMNRTSDFLEAVRKEKRGHNMVVSTEDIIQPRPQVDLFIIESYALVFCELNE